MFFLYNVGSGGAAPFNGLTLAPDTCGDKPQGNIVTNSSAAVGWIATQASKSALVAPIFKAIPKPCSISVAHGYGKGAGNEWEANS